MNRSTRGAHARAFAWCAVVLTSTQAGCSRRSAPSPTPAPTAVAPSVPQPAPSPPQMPAPPPAPASPPPAVRMYGGSFEITSPNSRDNDTYSTNGILDDVQVRPGEGSREIELSNFMTETQPSHGLRLVARAGGVTVVDPIVTWTPGDYHAVQFQAVTVQGGFAPDDGLSLTLSGRCIDDQPARVVPCTARYVLRPVSANSAAQPTVPAAAGAFRIATRAQAEAALRASPRGREHLRMERSNGYTPAIELEQTPPVGCTRGTPACRWIISIEQHPNDHVADMIAYGIDPYDGTVVGEGDPAWVPITDGGR